MSYVLDVMKPEEITEEDHLESYDQHGFTCVVDPKSMLYLFGLNLDYSNALIGGGFSFQNPNSQESCGCGKYCFSISFLLCAAFAHLCTCKPLQSSLPQVRASMCKIWNGWRKAKVELVALSASLLSMDRT